MYGMPEFEAAPYSINDQIYNTLDKINDNFAINQNIKYVSDSYMVTSRDHNNIIQSSAPGASDLVITFDPTLPVGFEVNFIQQYGLVRPLSFKVGSGGSLIGSSRYVDPPNNTLAMFYLYYPPTYDGVWLDYIRFKKIQNSPEVFNMVLGYPTYYYVFSR